MGPRKTDGILDFLFLHKPFRFNFCISIVTKFKALFANGFLAEQVLQLLP